MIWNVTEMVEAVCAGLQEIARERDLEQAVYGIDDLSELQLHPHLHRSLESAGYGVWPEQTYPSFRTKRKTKSLGKRCDIVLTHAEDTGLVDPEAEATLFGDADALPLEAAYWLEVKTVAQFCRGGPFARYAQELLSPVSQDIRKLAREPLIFHAGLMLVLFTADRHTAKHDLNAWEMKCLHKALPVAPPTVRDFAMTDRFGNGLCTVALFPVRRL
jgi:hypothetical protein